MGDAAEPIGRVLDPFDITGQRQEEAQDRASELVQQGMDEASAVQLAMFERMLELTAPFREAGVEALGPLKDVAFAEPATEISPIGQSVLDKRREAINRAMASVGGYKSGGRILEQASEAERITATDLERQEMRRLGILGSLATGGQGQASLAARGALTTGAGQAQTIASGYGTQALFPLQQEPFQGALSGFLSGGGGGAALSLVA